MSKKKFIEDDELLETTASEESEAVDTNDEKEDDIQDIDLSVIARKRFRIDGDNNKILYLNTSDMGMVTRISEAEEKLGALQTKVATLMQEEDDKALAKNLKEIDNDMRALVDFIFDANVSEICCDGGSMYDPIGGKLRYEHIIDRLVPLYEQNLKAEARQMSLKARQYTKKYTGR